MGTDYKIELTNVTKRYELYRNKNDRLKNFFKLRKLNASEFWSLKGINLKVKAGETLGLIGINGSGKSTISNIIAGIIPATTGTCNVKGEISIIAIRDALKWNLTGFENIRLKGLMQGLTIQEVEDLKDAIVDFADLGDFIDQPVKEYSSGMRSRLGFAIAVHINPDILIVDESLSVGDDTFYQRCVDKIASFKEQGKTIVFVSHSMEQIEMMCDRVAWIHFGDLKELGGTEEIVEHYREFIEDFKQKSAKDKREYQQNKKREQMLFDIKKYKQALIDEEVNQGSDNKSAEKKVNRILYKQILPDKMTFSTGASIVAAALLFIAVSGINISGHSISSVAKKPSIVFQPKHKFYKGNLK